MANGRPADHPFTDILIHGLHPLPADMEAMVKALDRADPNFASRFEWEPFDWTKREKLKEGRTRLRELLAVQGINPVPIVVKAVLWHYGFYLVGGLILLGLASFIADQVYVGRFNDLGLGWWSIWLYAGAPAIVGAVFLIRWFKNR